MEREGVYESIGLVFSRCQLPFMFGTMATKLTPVQVRPVSGLCENISTPLLGISETVF